MPTQTYPMRTGVCLMWVGLDVYVLLLLLFFKNKQHPTSVCVPKANEFEPSFMCFWCVWNRKRIRPIGMWVYACLRLYKIGFRLANVQKQMSRYQWNLAVFIQCSHAYELYGMNIVVNFLWFCKSLANTIRTIRTNQKYLRPTLVRFKYVDHEFMALVGEKKPNST